MPANPLEFQKSQQKWLKEIERLKEEVEVLDSLLKDRRDG
jgi:hypothetical protein